MKLYGSIKELVSAIFRKDGYEITVRPNTSITYSGISSVELPPKSGSSVLVSSGDIVNADIATGAAIALSKLATTGTINASAGIISANSATAAFRVTQVGTGNSLEVEDSTNPDSTPLIVDASGTLVVGHTASLPALPSFSAKVQVHGTGSSPTSGVNATHWDSNIGTRPTVFLNKSLGTSVNSHVAVTAGTTLGDFGTNGSDGSAFLQSTLIRSQADATFTSNSAPGRLILGTTPAGSSTPVERIRIDSTGKVGINNNNPSTTLDVTGTVTASAFSGPLTGNVTGNVSGSSATFTGSLSGDVSGTQSATSVDKVKGGAIPVSKTVIGTNSSGQLIDASSATLSNNTTGTAANVTGTVAIGNGGTGQTTANSALNALLPSQTSAANKYLKSDGTNTSWASASGGAGEINAVLNASGADGTTGWTGTTVVTGSNSPLNPIVTTAFSISNAATTESSTSGGYYPFTMPSGLMNRKLKIEFSYTTPATDVYKVSVYKGSTRVALSTDSGSPASTSLPASVTGGKFVAYFDTDNSSSWTVSITRTSGSTGPIYITNVVCGPGIQPQGAVVGETFSYTPTLSGFGTGATISRAVWTRRGTKMRIEGRISAGTVDASALTVSVPFAMSTIAIDSIVGSATRQTTTPLALTVIQKATDNNALYFGTNLSSGTGSGLLANSEPLSFVAEVEIAQWAGSGTLTVAQNDVEYAYNSDVTNTALVTASGFANGPSGVAISSNWTTNTAFTRRVRFQTPIQIGDKLQLELNYLGRGWVPFEQFYPRLRQASVFYGVEIQPVSGSSTDVDVAFSVGGYEASNATYGGNGTTWNNLSTSSWRLRKSSAGAAVGFGIVQPGTSAGLVSASGLPGNTTGNAIASGYVGEQKTAEQASYVGYTASNTTENVLSFQPGAGVWLVFGVVTNYANSATINGHGQYSINTTSATLSGSKDGVNLVIDPLPIINSGTAREHSTHVPPQVIACTASTTLYLCANVSYTSGTPLRMGSIRAIRIA